eukprot:TRINITY_DN8163_c0_g1_i1.p1 TRINITY_DN8163_c0_g1~~TRINITY_DN8163_c0_g1_i1.p1  ORF type:complete len:253 (-),score=41.52 TRINITY_DN8163_c0_g1_i1:662-1333(-)
MAQSPPRLAKAVNAVMQGERHHAGLQYPTFFLYPDVLATPWHVAEDYAWTQPFVDNWQAIYSEFLALKAASNSQFEVIPSSNYGGEWGAYNLWAQGAKQERNCSLAPLTTRLLEAMPEFMADCGLCYAYFSVVKPGTHITPHCGPANVKLRCHLGLSVPPEGATMRVARETRNWEEGKCLVFDDSFEHEVKNLGDVDRIVLLIDVWHPDLCEAEREAMRRFLQ